MPRTLRRNASRSTERTPVNDVHTDEEAKETSTKARRRRPTREDSDDEDEDEERPARRKTAGKKPAARKANAGWGAYEKVKTESGEYAQDFKVDKDEILFKFVEDEPFDTFNQHWIERKGKKSFTCLEEDCPLCDDLGDKPGTKVGFNVIDLSDPDEPVLKRWLVGTKVANAIKDYATSAKTSPINRDDLYWSVRRTGKQGSYQTNLNPVKERDLVDDWDTEPLTAEEIADLAKNVYGPESIEFHSAKQLQEIADEALGED